MFGRSTNVSGSARNEKVPDGDLHSFVVLIQGRRARRDNNLIWAGLRWPNLEHIDFHSQFISGADRARPAKLIETHADDAPGQG